MLLTKGVSFILDLTSRHRVTLCQKGQHLTYILNEQETTCLHGEL